MTDRELLELAAKAAGLGKHKYCEPWNAMALFDDVEGTSSGKSWNPLTSDGDALRLAAKLKIDIEWQSTGEFHTPDVEAYRRNPEGPYYCLSEHEDEYRRVIVRVAANIGESMP